MSLQNIIDNENLQGDRSKLQSIAKHYGIESQIRQSIEEMAELTQALCKQIKNKCSQPSLNVIEELADVSIMIGQLIYLFGCGDQVENVMKIKLNRQLERVKRGQ
jgi:NTP pyrophosphatase (non-canonical NTP hydrolase)